MRRRFKILLALFMLLAVAVGWPVWTHHRLKNRVAEYRRQLIAQGEKFSRLELVPFLPADRDNGADRLVAAAGRVGGINGSNQPPVMRALVPGRALVAWRQPILPAGGATNLWPGLREELAAADDALAEMRAALERPALAFQLDYSQDTALIMSHLSPLRRTAQWLSAATLLELHEGRPDAAWENLRALTALVSHYRDEPLIISSLVRLAIAAYAVGATWEALQSPHWSDAELAGLQAQWERANFLEHAEAVLRMERVIMMDNFAKGRNTPRAVTGGTTGTGQSLMSELTELGQNVLEDPVQSFRDLWRRYPGYLVWKWWWSYDDELGQMKLMQASLTALREARQEECLSPALDRCRRTQERIALEHPRAGRWFDLGVSSMATSYLSRLRAMEMQRHLVVAALALKRFHLRHGHYPETLAALAPVFCGDTPRDPVDGQPLRYRPQLDGSFLLYSVGENGVDDGGDPGRAAEASGSRRPFWLRGRDLVWPQSGGLEEFLLYQLEAEGERDPQEVRARVIITNGLSAPVLAELERLGSYYRFLVTNQPSPPP